MVIKYPSLLETHFNYILPFIFASTIIFLCHHFTGYAPQKILDEPSPLLIEKNSLMMETEVRIAEESLMVSESISLFISFQGDSFYEILLTIEWCFNI